MKALFPQFDSCVSSRTEVFHCYFPSPVLPNPPLSPCQKLRIQHPQIYFRWSLVSIFLVPQSGKLSTLSYFFSYFHFSYPHRRGWTTSLFCLNFPPPCWANFSVSGASYYKRFFKDLTPPPPPPPFSKVFIRKSLGSFSPQLDVLDSPKPPPS